jgi:hypothetical protein
MSGVLIDDQQPVFIFNDPVGAENLSDIFVSLCLFLCQYMFALCSFFGIITNCGCRKQVLQRQLTLRKCIFCFRGRGRSFIRQGFPVVFSCGITFIEAFIFEDKTVGFLRFLRIARGGRR